MARELRECGISLEGRDTKLQPQGRLSLRLTQPAGRGMPGIGGGGGVGSSRILPVLWSGTYGQGPEQRLLPSNKLELDLAQHKATNTAMP